MTELDWLLAGGSVLLVGSIVIAWRVFRSWSLFWIAVLLIATLFSGALGIALLFNKDEIPKVVGAGFGAVISAGIAFLISALTREREQEKSRTDQVRLEKAYWIDTWNTLPAICEEYLYWKEKSGQETDGRGSNRARSLDIVVEHMRSAFFDANLASLHRLPSNGQTFLLIFHDNLRLARERALQISELLVAYEQVSNAERKERDKLAQEKENQPIMYRVIPGRLGVFPEPPPTLKGESTDTDLGAEQNRLWIEIVTLAKELSEVLESALVHGWHAQEVLDPSRRLRKEADVRDERSLPTHNKAWIGTVTHLLSEAENRRAISKYPSDDRQ